MSVDSTADWTTGTPAIAYQHCASCGHVWYFERPFCPACGLAGPRSHLAGGWATVYAITTVLRAPSPELAAYAPYSILLLDAQEGFRMMAHGDPGLRIGDAVQMDFRRFDDRLLPYFLAAPVPGEHEATL
jgi:uncharacterized protein